MTVTRRIIRIEMFFPRFGGCALMQPTSRRFPFSLPAQNCFGRRKSALNNPIGSVSVTAKCQSIPTSSAAQQGVPNVCLRWRRPASDIPSAAPSAWATARRLKCMGLNCANDDGTNIWPSVATIARETELSIRTVQMMLRKLKAIDAAAQHSGLTRSAFLGSAALDKITDERPLRWPKPKAKRSQ